MTRFDTALKLTAYFVLCILSWAVALPWLIFVSFKTKYTDSIPARFFLHRNPPFDKSVKLWFHSCSFGETRSFTPLVEHFGASNVGFTTITKTGFDEAKNLVSNARFLPYEIFLPFWSKRVRLLAVMESELWLALFAVAKLKGAKTALISGRISDKSWPRYRKFRPYYSLIFSFVDVVLAQTQKDKERFEQLGAKNIVISGNIKLGNLPVVTKTYTKPDGILVCAASTHFGEEEICLGAFAVLKKQEPGAKLIVAPRHPERFEVIKREVFEFAQSMGFSSNAYTQKQSLDADITVLDTLGELVNIFAVSDIVILGGAFTPNGGHNPIEPAAFGCKLISGKNIHNHQATFSAVQNVLFCEPQDLGSALVQALNHLGSRLAFEGNPLEETKRALDELLHS